MVFLNSNWARPAGRALCRRAAPSLRLGLSVTIPRAKALPGRLRALCALRASSCPATLPLGPPEVRARHMPGPWKRERDREPPPCGWRQFSCAGLWPAGGARRAAIVLGGDFHRVSLSSSLFLQKSATGLCIPLQGVHKAASSFTKLPLPSRAHPSGRHLPGDELSDTR